METPERGTSYSKAFIPSFYFLFRLSMHDLDTLFLIPFTLVIFPCIPPFVVDLRDWHFVLWPICKEKGRFSLSHTHTLYIYYTHCHITHIRINDTLTRCEY